MKTFFEEYGFVLVSIIVVAILVSMVSPIGNKVKTTIESTIDSVTVDWAEDDKGNLAPEISLGSEEEEKE